MTERLNLSKKSHSSSSAPVHSSFDSRPFTNQWEPESKDGPTSAGVGNQPFSFNLSNIPLFRPDGPQQPTSHIQTKLTIGEPGDKYEQEADQVAARVVNQTNTPSSQPSHQSIQRQEKAEDEVKMKPKISHIQREDMPEKEKELQMKPMLQLQGGDGGRGVTPELETSIQQAQGGEQPLADNIREPNKNITPSAPTPFKIQRTNILPQDKAKSDLHKYAKPELFNNIPENMSDDEKVDQLLANFKNRTDFQYTGGRKRGFSNEGDCGTLVDQFLIIGKAILKNPTDLKGKEEADKPFFIRNGGKIIGDSRMGNVDGGKHWIFDQHVWIIYKNQVIDVLFGTKGQRWIRGTKKGDTYTFEGQQYKKSVYMHKTEWDLLSATGDE